jgi:hypothetical protein
LDGAIGITHRFADSGNQNGVADANHQYIDACEGVRRFVIGHQPMGKDDPCLGFGPAVDYGA